MLPLPLLPRSAFVAEIGPSVEGDSALIVSVVVVLILGGLLVVLLGAAMQSESESPSESESKPDEPD